MPADAAGSRADAIAREELSALSSRGLLRTLAPSQSPPGAFVTLGGERLVNFSSNDYLGLAADPRVARALADGALAWGAGAGASRLVTGDYLPQHELETALARFEGTDAAVLFNSGYAANCGLLPTFAGQGDLILSDALNHASLIDGCRLSRARVEVYPHADAGAVDGLLARLPGRRKLVVTDSIFSMDGDAAPLALLAQACERHGALLVLDEAHATGVLGPHGEGLARALGVRADLRMATLSKAAGVAGAHVSGSREVCDLLVNRARPLVYSTALPPALACAALASLQLLAGPEGDARRAHLRGLTRRLAQGLRALGLPASEDSPIFPVLLGEPGRALQAAALLRGRGFLVKPIRPPTVPEGTSRLRIALSAAHSAEQVDGLVSALGELEGG